MMNFTDLIVAVLGATLSVVFICLCGVYLLKRGFLDKQKQKSISKLTEQLFQPCLILSVFIQNLNLYDVNQWMPALIIGVLSIFLGFILGYLVNKFIVKDEHFMGVFILSIGLGHTTGILLNLSNQIQDYLQFLAFKHPNYSIMSQQEKQDYAIGQVYTYVIINTFIHTIFRWTYGKSILQKTTEKNKLIQQEKIDQVLKEDEHTIELKNIQNKDKNNQDNDILSLEKQDNDLKQNLLDKNLTVFNPAAPITNINAKNTEKIQSQQITQNDNQVIKEKIQDNKFLQFHDKYFGIMNPPLWSCVGAIIFLLIPNLSQNLITPGTFSNRFLFKAITLYGTMFPTFNTIVVGSSVYQSVQQKCNLSSRTLIGVIVTRHFINPIFNYLLILLLEYLGIVQDPILSYITLFTSVTGIAINILTIAINYSDLQNEVSRILGVGYVLNIITIPIALILFFMRYDI
ncbi:hypothetical protein PPERSA_11225 [Pseudocohnilembus persalinus]|uniref:Auxin efflux carrier n=1 Tax=Pseudocohnilembus persalinus TaxID=266149 RepID=A0A0V0QZE0_PSEPJ|nr:hypothetical protein PPERSA_11225 [Pseudocohnilembus persalinus]|eukprot:KRX07676.1 hypothetical protein PPERSA_11225 [Pseudocohnilembus persalinus]